MRVMLKVNIPVEEGNAFARKGALGSEIRSIVEDLKPEAVYFGDDHGQRTAFLFHNISSGSEIPRLCEPWFLAFNARIEMHPVMDPQDLSQAEEHIKHAVEQYANIG